MLVIGAAVTGMNDTLEGIGASPFWCLIFGILAAISASPIFAHRFWRRYKPLTILKYLAARSVSRRYAYGFEIRDLEMVFLYRGLYREKFETEEDEAKERERRAMHGEDLDLNNPIPVWVSLFRGGLVLMSEHDGGAKLEFIAKVTPELVLRPANENESLQKHAVYIEGHGDGRPRSIIIECKYQSSLYVFKQRLLALVEECKIARKKKQDKEDESALV